MWAILKIGFTNGALEIYIVSTRTWLNYVNISRRPCFFLNLQLSSKGGGSSRTALGGPVLLLLLVETKLLLLALILESQVKPDLVLLTVHVQTLMKVRVPRTN